MANDLGTALNLDNPLFPTLLFRGLHGDTNWQAHTSDGSAATIVDTGIPIDTNGHEFQIEVGVSGIVDFYIDDHRVAAISTSLPAASTALFDFAQIDTRGTTGTKNLNIAYMWWQNKN